MRLVINAILLLAAVVLAYMLYQSISEPIAFDSELTKREDIIIDKLKTIRAAQDMYRDITGTFAPSFDTLVDVLTNEKFRRIAVIGDPDDVNFEGIITYDTTYVMAIDSVNKLGLNLAQLRYVPRFADTELAEFKIAADTIDYQATLVAVVEVGTLYNTFMGKYSDPYYKKYDQTYSPTSFIKFGDLNKPNISGNWE